MDFFDIREVSTKFGPVYAIQTTFLTTCKNNHLFPKNLDIMFF